MYLKYLLITSIQLLYLQVPASSNHKSDLFLFVACEAYGQYDRYRASQKYSVVTSDYFCLLTFICLHSATWKALQLIHTVLQFLTKNKTEE